MALIRNLFDSLQETFPDDSAVRHAWRRLLPSAVRQRVRRLAGHSRENEPEYLARLEELDAALLRQRMEGTTGRPLRVLFGPSFAIYEPCFIHDRIFSLALRLRGATILPIYCDAIQHTECNVFGGVWKSQPFAECCRLCTQKSESLWRPNPTPPLKLSSYVAPSDVQEIALLIGSLGASEWASYQHDDLSFGQWARDLLVNNYVVGDYRLVSNHEELGRAHLSNLLLLHRAYSRILTDINPDRVVCNDSYYGMWAILQELCKHRHIPFYSHWTGGRQGGWCYAYNDAAMNLDFSKPWPAFSRIPLDARRESKVTQWLSDHAQGKEMILDTASLGKHSTDTVDLSKLDPNKPTALLAANVIWDLAALNKQVVFADMIDWIVETIRWFHAHPEYQLVVKPHPAELHPSIPATEERVELALAKRGVQCPPNVFLLTPKVNVTVYQLLPLVRVGLVHTTTVGMEMAAMGLSVITTARSPYRGFGFTADPITKAEYFTALQRALGGERLVATDQQRDLAYKFILFYHFHYYSKIDIMDYKWGQTPVLKVKSIEDLFPGKNPCLDYAVDSVMNGLPILSDDRWPPES